MRDNAVNHSLQSDFSTTKDCQKMQVRSLKESGIEWLGKIPEHWKLERCKNFFIIQNMRIGDLWNKARLLSLTLNGIIERDINNPEGKFPSDFSTYQVVRKNDLVFCLFDVEETPRTIGLATLEGMITSAYTVVRVQNQDERFVSYFFISLDNYKSLSFLYRGLRKTISKEDLLNLKIPLPPLEEQKAIADFLDNKCAKIEEFINQKERSIALLKELKSSLINQAVTKGLDKTTELKESGIEWLGQIPTHWEVKKLKHCCEINPKSNIELPNLFYYIDLESVTDGILWKEQEIQKTQAPSRAQRILKKGDILFQMVRPYQKNNFYFDKNGDYVASTGYAQLRTMNNGCFIYYALQEDSFVARVVINSTGSNYPAINPSDLGDLKIPLPPLEEQKAIAEYLDKKLAKIDLAIEKTQNQINLIKEYKTSLISEAVCGRVGIEL